MDEVDRQDVRPVPRVTAVVLPVARSQISGGMGAPGFDDFSQICLASTAIGWY